MRIEKWMRQQKYEYKEKTLKEKEDFLIPFSLSNLLIRITKIDYRLLGSGVKSYPWVLQFS